MAKTPRITVNVSSSSTGINIGLFTVKQADLNPIGMIVSALLTEPQFQALNGVSWVLLDGRSVAGSLYATTTGISTLPDARGLPLRGKNSGGSALGTRSDGGQNPDGDVALGTFQNDSMQGHWHAAASTIMVGNQTTTAGGTGLAAGGLYSQVGEIGNSGASPLNTQNSVNSPIFDGANGSPRTTVETRMKNITVNHFIKINP